MPPATRCLAPSPYWGEEKIWDTKANNHNGMFDRQGRVWFAAAVRGPNNPDFCKRGSDHPSAKLFPLERTSRSITRLDPKTMQYTFIDTCFGTHHLQFGYDANDTLWTSGGGPVVGWINTRLFDETGDAAKAQGWTALVLDTNGNGQRDEYVEPDQPLDPAKDKRISRRLLCGEPEPGGWLHLGLGGSVQRDTRRLCALIPAPIRLRPRWRKSTTCRGPASASAGADIDRQGVVWASLSSGHLASFDRRKCKRPAQRTPGDRRSLPGGLVASISTPVRAFRAIGENSAESSYYTWVDQHNTFGLGEDVPMSTANLMDGLVALKDGRMISLRVPYPLGFYAKGFDGRIDDPKAGWKGRGLWTTSGDRTPWLREGGKGSKPIAVHFQLRPDPLAK